MVFKRRKPRPILGQVRDAVYPRTGWRRAFEYVGHRIKRLPDTPHRIALGFACGVFVSYSPLFGMHFVAAAAMAMLVRGNLLASLLGTFFGNPLTFPFIATISLRTGHMFLGETSTNVTFVSVRNAIWDGIMGIWHSLLSIFGLADSAWGDVANFMTTVFFPYLLGGLVPGLLSGIACYLLARPVVAAYQRRRRAKLIKKSRAPKFKKMKTLADPAE